MKFLLLMVSLFIGGITKANTYYFSSSSGDDSRTSTQAQNPATPWKTITKLNSFFSSLSPGDVVLFLRGDIFSGTITPTKDGTSANPITFGAYGTGAKPIISGFYTIPAWTNTGSNIWESNSPVSSLSSLNMVLINGVNTAMGRYPNTGYLTYQSSTASSITSSSLSGSTDWSGAEAVIRMYRWVIDRNPITSQSGNTLNFDDNDGDYDPTDGFGFFLQNDERTLDAQNEWYYDPSSKKLKIYSTSVPVNVQVSTVTNLVSISSKDYLVFDNLSFQGANERAIYCNGGNTVTIQYCDILYSGKDAVYSYPNAPHIKIQYCTINHSNNSGLYLGNSDAAIVQHNTINNTGVFPGMGGYTNSTFEAVTANGDFSDISYNHIDTAGYNGIKFAGNGTNVRYNYVNYVCFNKDDGGGIYCYPLQGVGQTYANKRTVQGNIVLNSIGALESATGNQSNGHLIYNDGADDNTDYLDNTMAHTAYGGFGLFFNNARNSTVRNNTIYDCWKGFYYIKYTSIAMVNNRIVNNIFVAKTSGNYPAYYEPDETNMTASAFLDSNCYARPIDDNKTVWYGVNANNVYYTLPEWKSFTARELNSFKSPVAISSTNDLRLEYNETSDIKTVSLGTNYIDMKGVSYPGSITLQPNTSAILIKTGAGNVPPVANAGPDQAVSLPTLLITLSGSGTDPDGTISSYRWTKVSGPTSGIITSLTSAITTVTSLIQGVYKFELKVTDNNGATDTDTMQVSVSLLGNQLPTATAGSDQNITLPTNAVSLSGSGTDPDGTISTYLWTKVSGPASGSITNSASASTTATGMVQGIYKFELKVTDNNGATDTDTIQVTVNAAVNQPPTANAGSDQNITLPSNAVSLNGSGIDPDGTISTYLWTKVSGPASGSITNTTAASTTATGLVQGVYKFELKVTDNNGATDTDTIQVTVNAAVNQPPTANAGSDQNITLPANAVSLTGNGTDPDGTISTYLWRKVSGPTSGTITNTAAANTTVTALVQGIYKFELKVTDNNGATDTDTMQVTVNAANLPPTANAGLDQNITLPNNTTSLSGSGTDPDGTISTYLWRKISGPTSGTITNTAAANTTVTALVQGTYKFELKVTDNSGATDLDTMQVTVNPAANQAPTANAGSDQNITLPTNTVTLTGNGTDPDGTISAYLWRKISGPTGGTISNTASAATSVTGLILGVYNFELKVTDNSGATDLDTVQVTVHAAAPPLNQAPTANAGLDQNITLPTNSVSLNGSGTDPDGTITAYLWTKISGPTNGTITNTISATTSVTGMVQGVYKFQLKVTDNSGATDLDTMQVTVNAAVNQLPTANAGLDQNITLPTNSVSLNGSGTDPDGTITGYLWTKISGPANGTITNTASATTSVTGMVQGVYKFQLRVTDNNGAIDLDTMQVTVNAAVNQLPTANAGLDQNITLPTNSVSLNGSGTDPDGTITAYLWTKISGPTNGTITNTASATTSITGMVQGVYKFQLRVTDNSGATDLDTMQVTVHAAANLPPTANAGLDQNITLPANAVSLNGSGTDPDGTISAYFWRKISGPAGETIANTASATTSVTDLVQGVYKFELKVTDNSGTTDVDTMQVTVNPAPPPANLPPTANAGSDTSIYLPDDAVVLSGTGTDPDGTIVSYSWNVISGGANLLTNANDAVSNLSNLQQGVYEIELTVTDNDGAIGKDTVQITVGAGRLQASDIDDVIIMGNPVGNTLTAKINSYYINNRQATISVYDARGVLVVKKEILISQHEQLERIDMSRFKSGAYSLKVNFTQRTAVVKKVIKL